jgi:hypothetical protein
MVTTARDSRVDFPAFFVKGKNKTELRSFVARHALLWLRLAHRRGARGAVMLDIDDTLIDGHEKVAHGFEFMQELYREACVLFPVHVVTARPDSDHGLVMRLLQGRGFCLPPDRLHMLPADLYGRSTRHVEEFKWQCFVKMNHQHGGVVARFGDKLWDVAHLKSLDGYLAHVGDKECYIFRDPALRGTLSAKLPGL